MQRECLPLENIILKTFIENSREIVAAWQNDVVFPKKIFEEFWSYTNIFYVSRKYLKFMIFYENGELFFNIHKHIFKLREHSLELMSFL